MTEHDELENDVVAYVLGSADPEEHERLRAHLLGCASCRELAAQLDRGVSLLPLAAEPVQPPARLRERVRAATAAVRGASPPPPRRVRLLTPRAVRGPLRLPRVRVAAAAAAVLAFALGGPARV